MTPSDPGTRALAAAALRRAAGEAPAAARLRFLEGPLAGCRLALGEDETLGRGAGATLRLDDPAASRLHLRIRTSEGLVRAQDLRSKNGAAVNGRRLGERPRRLRPGDVLSLGATRLALELEGPPATPRRRETEPPPWPAVVALLLAAALLLAIG